MRKSQYNIWFIAGTLLTMMYFTSCGSDDGNPVPNPGEPGTDGEEMDVVIAAQDTTFSIVENPEQGQLIGLIAATASNGTESIVLNFNLLSVSIDGALAVDEALGEVTVANEQAFDFETNQTITARVELATNVAMDTIDIAVNITDQDETPPGTIGFITTWETTVSNESVTIPVPEFRYTYDYTIDWGDGTVEEGLIGDASHDYETPGIHTVTITGAFPALSFSENPGDGSFLKLQTIEQWGNIQWQSMAGAFKDCRNMTYNATDVPDLSQVTDLSEMFAGAESFNGAIGNWDVSNVTNMTLMFFIARAFNQDISDWDVSNVTNMFGLFQATDNFNQDISSWDVSNVVDMGRVFFGANAFNQDISTWDVSHVKSMSFMFNQSAFNQDIGNWDVSSVNDMSFMFLDADAFNQDIGNWNVRRVTNMTEMFRNADIFNQDLSRWNVSAAENVSRMFDGAVSFNQDLGSWDISSVNAIFGILDNSGLSEANYDATLDGWSILSTVPSNLNFGGTGLTFCDDGVAARNLLIDEKGWTFSSDISCSI